MTKKKSASVPPTERGVVRSSKRFTAAPSGLKCGGNSYLAHKDAHISIGHTSEVIYRAGDCIHKVIFKAINGRSGGRREPV